MAVTSVGRLRSSRNMFFVALVALGLVSCAADSNKRIPPFALPFDAVAVGSQTSFDVNIVKEDLYSLAIFYSGKNTTPEEARRVGRLLGVFRQDASGKYVAESGVPASFRVQIHAQPGHHQIFDQVMDHPLSNARYMGRVAYVMERQSLKRGIYSVTLSYLDGAPELAAFPTTVEFKRSYQGK